MLGRGIKKRARELRKSGKSHRDIARELGIGLGSAFLITKGVKLSKRQHLHLMQRGVMKIRKTIPAEILKEAYRRGGKNAPNKFKPKYTKEQLIDLIRQFHRSCGRAPTKREFYHRWQPFRRIFGSWNKAIIAAGFKPNPVLFAKKWKSKDGHGCDSLSEKIIDDWLYLHKLYHERNVSYPGQKKFTVDFLVDNSYWLEFVGLAGSLRSYDRLFSRKIRLAKENGIKIIKIYPKDLFPLKKLSAKLRGILGSAKKNEI